MQSITIPDGVTSIGAEAFKNCKNLQSITAPKLSIKTFDSPELKRAAVFGYLQNRELFLDAEIADGYQKYAIGQRKKLLPIIFKNDAVAALDFYAETKS